MAYQLRMIIGCFGLFVLASTAIAAEVTLGGQVYESVDWSSVDATTNLASGTAAAITVDLSAVDIRTNAAVSSDYSTDTAYDALTFGGGVESISINADIVGTTTINFSAPVISVLIILGIPGSVQDIEKFGASQWNFDDALLVEVVDTQVITGTPDAQLQILAGNILDNPNDELMFHVNGVVSVDGAGLTSIVFTQRSVSAGGDGVNLALAIMATGSGDDMDGDGVIDSLDNCTEIPNPDQLDTNSDGFGNICDPDLNNDNVVDFGDLPALQQSFFSVEGGPNFNPDADVNGDSVIDFGDLPTFQTFFFQAPGPSGLVP